MTQRLARPLAALIATLALAAVADAAEWRSIGRTFGGNEVFVDAPATRVVGDLRTTWVRVVYARPIYVDDLAARSTEALAHFDCRAGASAGIAVIFYDDGGRVLKYSVESTVTFHADPDGSFGAIAGQALCR
jgi:hypothetical protein